MRYPWLSKSHVSRLSRERLFLIRLASDCKKEIKFFYKFQKRNLEVVRWQKFLPIWKTFLCLIADLHFLPLEFVSLSLCLKNSSTNRKFGFFLLRKQKIFCLFTWNEKRFTNIIRLLKWNKPQCKCKLPPSKHKQLPSTLCLSEASTLCNSPATHYKCKRFEAHEVDQPYKWYSSNPWSMPSARYQCLLLHAYLRYQSLT